MVWTYHVGTHFEALEKFFIMKVAFLFVSTKVGFQIPYGGHVNTIQVIS